MTGQYCIQVRVTGILINEGQILVVKQVLENRTWSLPGGRVERGETIEAAMRREILEETGLEVEIIRLLYLCENNELEDPILHVTFLLRKTGGSIRLPSNEYDENPIHDVKMVPLQELPSFGFSREFVRLAINSFPGAGAYKGHKRNIGL